MLGARVTYSSCVKRARAGEPGGCCLPWQMAGNGGCFPNGRGYSTLAMDQPSSALFSEEEEATAAAHVQVSDAKDAGALFVLESKGKSRE